MKSLETWPCFECDTGTQVKVLNTYVTVDGEGLPMVIHDVPHCICCSCTATAFDAEACRMIEAARRAAGVLYRGDPGYKKKATSDNLTPPVRKENQG
jgi:hypothetical protein